MKDPYALAIVVRRRAPVSSHVGDRAIVHADGRMEGFIGGACSRDIVRKAALEALESGEPRLVNIDPMTCASEGAIDVYIEPELPQPYFFIAGFTPVAHSLAQIAPKLDFAVVHFVQRNELADVRPLPDVSVVDINDVDSYLGALNLGVRGASSAIAATQGHYDETALSAFLEHGIGFTGLLASEKRGRSVVEVLVKQGLPQTAVDRIHYPVGLEIGARHPGDVAISIFAQIIAQRSAQSDTMFTVAAGATAVDPVCGMAVEIVDSHDRAEYNGALYYFCGSHCSAAFAAEPEQYVCAVSPP